MKVLVISLANSLIPAVVLTDHEGSLAWMEDTGDGVFQVWSCDKL